MPAEPKAYTVTAITRLVKTTLEESFSGIWVEGEISNYHLHSSGHRYFSLKDERAAIRVTLWRSLGAHLKFEPEDGQKVLVYGDVTVYERSGQYQLNCRKLVPVGVGELELAFKQLYEKLLSEGLFEQSRKKPMPEYPTRIGIVTSPTSAAIRDIIQIARRRNPAVELVIFPAQVQGDRAEKTIAEGIEYFNSLGNIDIIVTGRGGGSLEDLWAFNTELLVRAIAASEVPVVSAVGHEVDTTLTDFVADLRAPTPSAAAELVIWSRREFLDRVYGLVTTQSRSLRAQVAQAKNRLSQLLTRPAFARPENLIDQRRQYLDHWLRLLAIGGKNSFETYRNRLSLHLSRLEALSPLKILARGYSVTQDSQSGAVIVGIGQVERDGQLETIVTDGRIYSRVERTVRDKRKTQ